jgi:hypothetical protein
MDLRTIPRSAVDAYLKAVRRPVDLALVLLGGDGGATAVVDRLDATARTVAGYALGGDPRLLEDAQRLHEAGRERARAARLREEAELRAQRGEEDAEERRRHAQRTRAKANGRAQEQRKRADTHARQKAKRAEQAAAKRHDANERATEATREAVHDQAQREKLEALETRSEALEEREEALTARDEARRLGDAAARVKAERKKS